MINKEQVVRRFGKRSHSYDEYARVQKKMAAALTHLAKEAGNFTKILEIGCGTGYFTRLIASLFPRASILATDIAPGMLAAAKINLLDFKNIHYALEDGENLQTSETFDLIISNAAFQWFNNYPLAYAGFLDHLNPGGHLIYATLGPQTFHELHSSFDTARNISGLHSGARHGQSFTSSAALHTLMTSLGYTKVSHTEEFFREYFPAVKDFLVSIKKIGANNANLSNPVVNRRLMFSMMRAYEHNFRENGQIYATYHVIYGNGQKK
jgi:malonyl-CoA O-methyltransferase